MKENSEIRVKQKKSFQARLGYKAFHNFGVEVQYKLDQENTFVFLPSPLMHLKVTIIAEARLVSLQQYIQGNKCKREAVGNETALQDDLIC